MTTPIIAVSSQVRKTITVSGIPYGLGKVGHSYFVMNMDTETWRSFTSKSAFNWYVDTLIAAGDRLDPTPTIPAIQLRQEVSVAAVATTRHEHRISTRKYGEMSREISIAAAVSAYTRKYHQEPTLIKLHEFAEGIPQTYDFYGIEVEYSKAIPADRIWVGVK